MGRPYSLDLRERVVAAVEKGGLPCNRAAAQFGLGISAVIDGWRVRETGSVAPGQMGGHKPKAISGEHREWLLQRVREKDFTIRGWLPSLPSGAFRSIVGLELHPCREAELKKKHGRQRTRSSRHRAPTRAMGKVWGRIQPERLVFIDETWTKTNMAPLRGWSLCGTRLTAKVPHGRCENDDLCGRAAP